MPPTRRSRASCAKRDLGGAILRARSALGVLRRLAGLLEAGLLALDDARVATEETGLLEGRAVVLLVDLVQRAGHTEAHSASLAGRAAALKADDHVEAALEVEDRERVVDLLLVQLVREVVLEAAAVDGPLAGAGDQANAGDGALATAGAVAGRSGRLASADGGLAGRLGGEARGGRLVGHVLEGLRGGLSHGSPWFFRAAGRSGGSPRLLRHLVDGEGDGLLRGVRVLGARVHLELLQLLISELVLGEHAADGLLHRALGVLLEQLGVGDAAEAAGVAGVAVGELRLTLVSGQRDLVGVDDDDEVARIHMGCEDRLVLPPQELGSLGSE